jgi:hypothetical protein
VLTAVLNLKNHFKKGIRAERQFQVGQALFFASLQGELARRVVKAKPSNSRRQDDGLHKSSTHSTGCNNPNYYFDGVIYAK